MLKHALVKLLLVLALVLTLAGGFVASARASAVQIAPAHRLLACGAEGFPPCW
ncbi:MAG TPA: hypothetical protein VH540_05705 [Ktedonobacterales bacterium]|jgi:hypothetical protein